MMPRLLFIGLILLLTTFPLLAQDKLPADTITVFRIASLPPQGVLLDKGWKWLAGDNPDWARPEFDDSRWSNIDPTKDIMDSPQLWQTDIGWFRLRFTIDSTLASQSIAMLVHQTGASEYFLNGQLIGRYGEISSDPRRVRAATPSDGSFVGMPIRKPGEQVLAIRFALQKNLPYLLFANRPNTTASLHLLDTKSIGPTTQSQITHYFDFTRFGLFLILSIIHLALFWFTPSQKSNLYFFLYAFLNAISSILIGLVHNQVDFAATKLLFLYGAALTLLVGFIPFLMAVYSIINHRRGILYWALMAYALISLIALFTDYRNGFSYGINTFIAIIPLESIRIIFLARKIRQRGGNILFWGAVSYLIFYALFFAFVYGYIPAGPYWLYGHLAFNVGILSLAVAISVYLALESSYSSRSLKETLLEVQQLSAEKQQILATENERLEQQVQERTAELADKNRELVIEAALERVRSASLAMHQSDELEKVVVVLFNNLKELDIPFDATFIYLFDFSKRNIEAWVATKLLPNPLKVNMPYDEAMATNPIIADLWYAIEHGEHGLNKSYKEKDKDDYYKYEAKHNQAIIPESITDFQLQAESWTTSFATEKNSIVGFDNWKGYLTNNEDFQLLQRFARVFEQAYTRFLDLQKAEAQAREVQIELALERIRSEAMAMHSSEGLLAVTQVLRQQMALLEQKELESILIHIYNEANDTFEAWFSYRYPEEINGKIITGKNITNWSQTARAYKDKEKYYSTETDYTIVANYTMLKEWYEYLETTVPEVVEHDEQGNILIPDILYYNYSKFSGGALVLITNDEASDDSRYLLKRSAEVFNLAYTRFLDLQKAELQALALREEKQRLEKTLTELRMTQTQLIQREKMASLGELTAGIAHEIQNPLNFVTNFSEVSTELASELREELQANRQPQALELAHDLTQNLEKITLHGRRASAIVKGMLDHSRSSTGQREPANLNALATEYLRLAYQGQLAKDKSFTAELKTNFDPELGLVDIIPQEIGRVVLNLYNNAFYAVRERQKQGESDYQPTITVSTLKTKTGVDIRVSDNGTGMPEAVQQKIFQPFFTTKPTGEGTGLGLSLSYDIITKGHGGSLLVQSQEGEGTEFTIQLPAAGVGSQST